MYNPDYTLDCQDPRPSPLICLEFTFTPCLHKPSAIWNLRRRCASGLWDLCVCVCVYVLYYWPSAPLPVSDAGCSVQIKVCRYFAALTLRQPLSADSPVGCVSPALGDINTPLMSPFLEESGNNRWEGRWGGEAAALNQSFPCATSPLRLPGNAQTKRGTQLQSH